MCTKVDFAQLLNVNQGRAKETYDNVCKHLEGVGSVCMPAELSTCSLHACLAAFPAVKTFGKPAKPPNTGLHMPPVSEQLQISANHFANSMLVLWALLPSEDAAADCSSGHSKLVWGAHLLTKQMFLEYQTVSSNGLRRMMDAPIVSTARCHAVAKGASADASSNISSLHTLEQCKLVATVRCLTHKHVTVSVSWLVSRASDDAIRVDPSMVTERRRRDMSQQRLFSEGNAKNAIAGLRPLQRMTTLSADSGLAASAHGASSRITESFIGAGILSTALEIGTGVGSQACSLNGVFLHSGQYDVSLQIESVKDAASGLALSVHDYAVCHPLHLRVDAPYA
eukprot:jgi/Ulvmu1/5176/UM021_0193.1